MPQDTENDGTPDHLDTDADGDGRFDALEAGFTDANEDGQVDGTGYDTDGKVTGGDGYTTPADTDNSGTADYLESGVATCALDTDGDGISDVTDLDDDNDGIIDTDEGCTITYSYTNATANSNGEYTIHVITDGLADSLPYDTGYSEGAITFTANNLVTGSFTIEYNYDYLHDNTNNGDGQLADSNGLQYLAGTTTYIASEARAVVTNNTSDRS